MGTVPLISPDGEIIRESPCPRDDGCMPLRSSFFVHDDDYYRR